MSKSGPGQPTPDEHMYGALREALAAHLYREAKRLGLVCSVSQVASLCAGLLSDEAEVDDPCAYAPLHTLRESALFNTSYSENLEVHDYLHLVSRDMRKRLGQYTTPSVVVKYILDQVGYRATADLLDRRVVDPACGSGIFLVEAGRVYLRALRRMAIPMELWYPRVRDALVGLDIDPTACLYARFNLSLSLAAAILVWADANREAAVPPLQIRCLDTLRKVAAEARAPNLFLYDTPEDRNLIDSFDLVVANPPYRKTGRLDPGLKQAFGASLYGHPNAYGLFLHAGLEMVRPGGFLGYIVPRSMLSGLYFKNLRTLIERRALVREATLIADRRNVFENVLQGTMVLILQRQPAPGGRVKTGIAQSVADLETGSVPAVRVPREKVMRALNGTSVWFVVDNQRTSDILDRIVSAHPLLSSRPVGCPARTGPIVWNRVKPLLRAAAGPDTLPLVWATDVGRFAFSFGSAGGSRPSHLELTARTRRLSKSGLSVFVQRVTADEQPRRLVACVAESFCAAHPAGYFVENHLNVIQPSATAPHIDLYYLVGVLCSDAIEFFFRAMNGNTQVSATELNLMPIPRGDLEPAIASLARRLHRTSLPVARERLEGQLNQAVARAYGLTREELAFIQAALARDRVGAPHDS